MVTATMMDTRIGTFSGLLSNINADERWVGLSVTKLSTVDGNADGDGDCETSMRYRDKITLEKYHLGLVHYNK